MHFFIRSTKKRSETHNKAFLFLENNILPWEQSATKLAGEILSCLSKSDNKSAIAIPYHEYRATKSRTV